MLGPDGDNGIEVGKLARLPRPYPCWSVSAWRSQQRDRIVCGALASVMR